MQAFNVIKNSSENVRPLSDIKFNIVNEQQRLSLLSRLQTTLIIEELLDIFLDEIANFIDIINIQFSKSSILTATKKQTNIKSVKRFPIVFQGHLLGYLSYFSHSQLTLSETQLLLDLQQYLINPINNALKYSHAISLALKDPLTHLGNRRDFDEQLLKKMSYAMRKKSTVGLIFCDLDKFKIINDHYGHDLGDEVLLHFAQTMQNSIRDCDSAFRFGGDEFAIIVQDANESVLEKIKQRIKANINIDPLLCKYQLTTSFGVTLMTDKDNTSKIFNRADKALYVDKNNTIRIS